MESTLTLKHKRSFQPYHIHGVAQVEAGVDEALDSSGWADAMALVPAALTPADAAALLARCPSVQRLGAHHRELVYILCLKVCPGAVDPSDMVRGAA